MKKPLSLEERTLVMNTAVVMFRNHQHAVLDLLNLWEAYPDFMEEHYTFPDALLGLHKESLRHLERAEANLLSRKLLVL